MYLGSIRGAAAALSRLVDWLVRQASVPVVVVVSLGRIQCAVCLIAFVVCMELSNETESVFIHERKQTHG